MAPRVSIECDSVGSLGRAGHDKAQTNFRRPPKRRVLKRRF